MTSSIQKAREAIYAYTFGMDTGDWKSAVCNFAETVDIDYSEVGGPKGQMSISQVQEFLEQLLGKQDLRVHTAVSQVLENPTTPSEFIAYYSVRHYKGQIGQAEKFAVFGWYSYRLQQDVIVPLKVNVSAFEGNPAVLT